MTAPFAPPPSRLQVAVLLGMLVFAIAAPFAKRPGWIGGVALAVITLLGMGLWGILLWGFGTAIRRWWQGPSENE